MVESILHKTAAKVEGSKWFACIRNKGNKVLKEYLKNGCHLPNLQPARPSL